MANEFHWGPTNPHPLSKMRTELVWEGKYDEFGHRRRGFTLIELVVVIAIIAILASLLLATLARGKAKAWAAVCLGTKKQLALAWYVYQSENRAEFPLNYMDAGAAVRPDPDFPKMWVAGFMLWNTLPDSTNVNYLMDPRWASLGPYARNPAIYKCPSDRYLSQEQRALGWKERVRSVSMNWRLGQDRTTVQSPGAFSPWTFYWRMEDLINHSPSMTYVFIDEHPDSVWDISFWEPAFVSGKAQWGFQLPGSLHDGAGTLDFADGHAEIRHWLEPTTKLPVKYKTQWYYDYDHVSNTQSSSDISSDDRDARWLWNRVGEPVRTP